MPDIQINDQNPHCSKHVLWAAVSRYNSLGGV